MTPSILYTWFGLAMLIPAAPLNASIRPASLMGDGTTNALIRPPSTTRLTAAWLPLATSRCERCRPMFHTQVCFLFFLPCSLTVEDQQPCFPQHVGQLLACYNLPSNSGKTMPFGGAFAGQRGESSCTWSPKACKIKRSSFTFSELSGDRGRAKDRLSVLIPSFSVTSQFLFRIPLPLPPGLGGCWTSSRKTSKRVSE